MSNSDQTATGCQAIMGCHGKTCSRAKGTKHRILSFTVYGGNHECPYNEPVINHADRRTHIPSTTTRVFIAQDGVPPVRGGTCE